MSDYLLNRVRTLAAELESARAEVDEVRRQLEVERERSLYLSGVIDGMKGVVVEDGPTCEALERGREEGRKWLADQVDRMRKVVETQAPITPGDASDPEKKVAGPWTGVGSGYVRWDLSGERMIVAVVAEAISWRVSVTPAEIKLPWHPFLTLDAARAWCDTQLRAQGWEVGDE